MEVFRFNLLLEPKTTLTIIHKSMSKAKEKIPSLWVMLAQWVAALHSVEYFQHIMAFVANMRIIFSDDIFA